MQNLIPIEVKPCDVKCGKCKGYFKVKLLYNPVTKRYFEQAYCPECKVSSRPKLIRIGRQTL